MTESAKRVLWRDRVLAFDRSGLQRGVWCARHGFKVATLDYWRQQFEAAVALEQRLIPIRVNAAIATSALGEVKIEIGADAYEALANQINRAYRPLRRIGFLKRSPARCACDTPATICDPCGINCMQTF